LNRLGEFERDLLGLLTDNSRRSLTELALRLETTRPRVRRGIAKLESSGIIRRYTVETNGSEEAELKRTSAFFVIKTKVPRCRVFIEKVRSWPEIKNIWTFSSREIDVQIQVITSTDEQLEILREKVSTDPSVQDMHTMGILSEWKK